METTILRRFGNSIGVIFDRGVLTKIYDLDVGDEVEIDYTFDGIIIKPVGENEQQQ